MKLESYGCPECDENGSTVTQDMRVDFDKDDQRLWDELEPQVQGKIMGITKERLHAVSHHFTELIKKEHSIK